MHLDLHLHTTCSDGTMAPEALPAAARRAGLQAIAVTDHDTTAGVAPAQRAAAGEGVLVIPGTELTTDLDGAEVHLLGYGIDPDDPHLRAITTRRQMLRRERLEAMLERLRGLGVVLRAEDVTVPEGNVAVGRPHVAEALLRKGVVRSVQEAFSRFLADGGPAWVPARGPDVASAIEAVSAAGGCSVWAHPALEDARSFGRLREAGLVGVEALRPTLSPTASSALEHAAREVGLLISGGSDWHGGQPALGSWFVTDKHVRGLLDRLGVEVH